MDKTRLKTLILYHIYSSKILVGILLLIMIINLLLGIAFKNSMNGVGSIDIASYLFQCLLDTNYSKKHLHFL